MRITADTNVLVRSLMDEDTDGARARAAMLSADRIAVTLPTFCEFVWILSVVYKKRKSDIAIAIRALIAGNTVSFDGPAVAAGLALVDAGGDFADGVIAFEGRRLGGDVFVTFDKQAAKLIAADGGKVDLLKSNQ